MLSSRTYRLAVGDRVEDADSGAIGSVQYVQAGTVRVAVAVCFDEPPLFWYFSDPAGVEYDVRHLIRLRKNPIPAK
jgi:hypothetical protein